MRKEPLLDRFERKYKIDSESGCWIWTGAMSKGYGYIGFCGRNIQAHRVSYELFRGPIPNGLSVLHNCPKGDNPACVNPDHLWVGTPLDNSRDMTKKGRGHKSRLGLPYGVAIDSPNRFRSQVYWDGKLRYLGLYKTPEEAHEVAIRSRLGFWKEAGLALE